MKPIVRWLIACTVVLLVANGALMALLWVRDSPAPPSAAPGGDAREHLIRELRLTPQQTAAFDSLRAGHFPRMDPVRRQLRETREALYTRWDWTATQRDSLTAMLGQLQASHDRELHTHFAALYALLTPRQKERFAQAIAVALPPRRGGGGAHDGKHP